MKKTLLKDSIKEIKNTYKRFISIVLMAFLGVGFFAGMRAASPDMVETIDQYYKENNIYDIQILSTLGLTKLDKEKISKLETIETVVGTYEMDGMIEIENKEIVTKIMCVEELNKPVLLQGNLPKTQEECVIEEKFLTTNHKQIGDWIELKLEKTKNDQGEEIEYLKQNKVKIVGTVKSPLYISRDRGTSNLGTGRVDYYLYLAKENILADEIYTNVYIKVKDAEKYKTNSKQYKKKIEEAKKEIETIKNERQKARHDDLVDIATTRVEEAEGELKTEKQKAEEQIEKAQREIEKGKTKIQKAEEQITVGKKEADTQFTKGYQQIQIAKKQIEANENELKNKEQEANQQIESLNLQKQELQIQLETINKAIVELEKIYQLAPEEQKQVLEMKKKELEQKKSKVQLGITQIESGITKGKQELEKGKTQLQNAKSQLANQEKQYEQEKNKTYAQIEKVKVELETSKQKIREGEEELEKNKKELEEKVIEAEQKLEEAKEEIIKIEFPKWYLLEREGNSGYSSFIQDTGSVENIATVFPIVFFLVAVLISLTSMTRMVEEQRTQIGTLKALGYSKIQIASKYIIYASLACVIGGLLGMSVGFIILPTIIWKMYQMMYQMTDQIQLSFNWELGAIGLILISVCILGATIYSIRKELVNSPATLMRPKAPKMGKRVILERIPFIWKHLSFSRKVTVRNIFRYRKRFLMTIIGILGCTALILVGFGLRDSIQNIMPSQFEEVFQYDMQIALKTNIEEESKQEFMNQLQKREGVGKIIETYMTSSTACYQEKKEDVQIIVPKEKNELEGMINLTEVKTKHKVEWKENEIFMTDKLAELLGVKQGDTIVLKNSDEKEIKVKVSTLVKNYISHYIYMSKTTYEKLYQETYSTNVLFTQNQEKEEIEEELATYLMEQNEVATVSRISTVMDMMDDTMKSLNYVVMILIVSAGLLAFVVLYNLSNVNISERIRELATIKVLGFYDKEVYLYVTRETIILTAIGIGLGLIAGYFLNYFIIGTCEINMLRFQKIVHPMSYVYATGITIGFTIIVNRVTYFTLKKINMIESLKSVE